MNSFEKKLCNQEVDKEQANFQKYLSAFRALDDRTQKPYSDTVSLS